jgi:hypothetical protein
MAEGTYGNKPVTEELRAGTTRNFPDPRFAAANSGSDPHADSASSDAHGMQDKAMDKAAHAKDAAVEKTSEMTGKARESADAGVNRAAEGLEQAAVQLRERAEDGGGVQEKVGVRVADGLDKTSSYLRDHETQEIWTDVEKFVKEHPMQAAVGAAVAGYLVAKVLK